MADNTRGGSQDGADPLIATDEVTYSGDTADVQLMRPVHVSGAEGSKTVDALTDATGLNVHVVGADLRTTATLDGVNDAITIALAGAVEAAFTSLGTPSLQATVQVELSLDGGTNWISGFGYWSSTQAQASSGLADSVLAVAGDSVFVGRNWAYGAAGATHARLRVSAFTAGSLDMAAVALTHPTGFDENTATLIMESGRPANVKPGNIDAHAAAENGLVTNARNEVYNGTTWDRVRGDTTNGLDVDVTRLPALAAGTNNIGDVDVLSLPALPAGTNNIGDVDVLTLPGVGGLAAHASPASGNPVYVAGRASAAIPTDVGADGDAAGMWTNRNGATVVLMAPHVGLNSDPWNLVHEGAQYTSAQTSTVLVAGGAGDKIVVTKVQIQAYATTAGTAILYFGTGAYSRGTNRALFDGEFAPSATLKPGVVLDGPFISGANGDDLLVTTTNALSITFSVWYYVVV
jgi:hypothetical protein